MVGVGGGAGRIMSVNDYPVWRFCTQQKSHCGLLLAAFGSGTILWSLLLRPG